MEHRDTQVVVVDPDDPDVEQLKPAIRQIRAGGLVAFPTETVYGLGADALSEEAVAGIFEAKARPATNPLIVHVASVEQARGLAAEWPEQAQRLAERFWPGPLTLVVARSPRLPDAVCAGLPTVALRMPSHPVARRLIEEAGTPVAAPSANRYTEISPTTADHVLRGLEGRIDVVVDGGPTSVGVESTLVSMVDSPAEVLRPGMIDRRQLEEIVELKPREEIVVDEQTSRPSPGLSERHYSPGAVVRVVETDEFKRLLAATDETTGFVGRGTSRLERDNVVVLPDDAVGYARRLYDALHRLDEMEVTEIVVERPPAGEAWEAIRDRLKRAAGAGGNDGD